MKKLILLLLLFALTAPASFPKGSRSSRSSSDSKKTVHVKSYTRKDGTVVRAHDRSAPGTASHSTSRRSSPSRTVSSSGTTTRSSNGRIKRSATAKNEFIRSNPCPSTGKRSGACPDYVVDHVKPLACGGADAPGNMQWQTTTAAKAKDKWERNGCR